MLSKDILHTARGLTPDRKASKRGGARDPPNGDARAGAPIGYAIFIPSTLDGDQVISRRDVAILNAHIAARICSVWSTTLGLESRATFWRAYIVSEKGK